MQAHLSTQQWKFSQCTFFLVWMNSIYISIYNYLFVGIPRHHLQLCHGGTQSMWMTYKRKRIMSTLTKPTWIIRHKPLVECNLHNSSIDLWLLHYNSTLLPRCPARCQVVHSSRSNACLPNHATTYNCICAYAFNCDFSSPTISNRPQCLWKIAKGGATKKTQK